MKRVLVTGASGFIGKMTLPFLLERGFEVHCITQHLREKDDITKQCTWHIQNLLDFTRIKQLIGSIQPEFLLHLAWNVTPGMYLNANENFMWLKASMELMRAFYDCGGQRMIGAGTCLEYDLKNGYCTEECTPLFPVSRYALCKHLLNNLLSGYVQKKEVSYAWGRIFYLYGPGEYPSRLVSSIICSLVQGKYAQCSHGLQIRDYLYVTDVAEAFVALLDSDLHGEINICSGIPLLLKEIISKIGSEIGRPELIKFGALSAPKDEPPIIVGDATRLKKQLHWIPKYSLDKGLANTIAWWRNYFKTH